MISNRHIIKYLLAIFILCSAATMAIAAGTPSGTTITNTATITAANALSGDTDSVALTVTDVYGLATDTPSWDPADNMTTAGTYVDYTFSIKNNGNASDTVRLNAGLQTFSGSPGTQSAWTVGVDTTSPYFDGDELVWTNSGTTAALAGGDRVDVSVGADTTQTFAVRVSTAGDAGDSSEMKLTISFETLSSPSGSYTGINGLSYGGSAVIDRAAGSQGAAYLATQIQGVVISISKSRVILAPTTNGYAGVSTDAVPGAKITYTISYSNTGSVAADNVVITDSLANYTTYVAGSLTPTPACAMSMGDTTITCNLGTVGAAGSGTITYEATID